MATELKREREIYSFQVKYIIFVYRLLRYLKSVIKSDKKWRRGLEIYCIFLFDDMIDFDGPNFNSEVVSFYFFFQFFNKLELYSMHSREDELKTMQCTVLYAIKI